MIDLNSGFIVEQCEKSDLVLVCSTFTLFQVKHPEKYEFKKKDEREQLRLYRQKKKPCTRQKQCWRRATPKETAKPAKSTPKSFSTKQVLSRGIKQVEKALPVSPRKKTEVIRGLVKQYQIRVKLAETRGRKRMVLSEEEK